MSDDDSDTRANFDALVASARTDRSAFGRLYEAYYDRIFVYCVRRLASRSAAEDVVSDVFLFVARNMRTFRGSTELDFRRWAYRIATTEVNAYLRRTRRRARLWDQVVDRAAELRQQAAPDVAALEESERSRVNGALAQLTPREQSLVALRLMEDLPHGEVARILNLREGTARAAYRRALQKLRALLGQDADAMASQTGPGG